MQGRSRTSDLLPHVTLNVTEQLGRKVEKVGNDRVDGNEIETQVGIHLGVVVGGDGGGAVYRTHVVEVTESTQLVVDLAHDADVVRGLLGRRATHVHVLLRNDGKQERNVWHLATNQL